MTSISPIERKSIHARKTVFSASRISQFDPCSTAELCTLESGLVFFRPYLVAGDGAMFEWGICDPHTVAVPVQRDVPVAAPFI
jgi:hypothetical protein